MQHYFSTIYNFRLTTVFYWVCDMILVHSIEFANRTYYEFPPKMVTRYIRQTDKWCLTPINPDNTQYTILGQSESRYEPGYYVKDLSILEISCNKGYILNHFASNNSICRDGLWNQPPTACIRTCSSLISTKTTTVKCTYDNIPLKNCINPVTGTIATLSCKSLYEDTGLGKSPLRICRENKWYPPISQCYPTCGIKHPKGKANIVRGRNVTIGDYPWQVGIYYSANKELLCGGSIIQQNIILSAAHCVTDHSGNKNLATDYLIAAGKFFRYYDDNRDQLAQYSNVLSIYIPERYTGIINNYALDIAILILSHPFKISLAVQPVCIELQEEYQNVDFLLNTSGIVTGWGYTEKGRELSEELKELIVPYVAFSTCFREVPVSFRKYITQDKLCGGYINNGMSVCSGDSGGALVFKNKITDRYFVKGVVSTSPATTENICDSNEYSLYTSVTNNINFLRVLVVQNQIHDLIECTGEDCLNEDNENEDDTIEESHSCGGSMMSSMSSIPLIAFGSDVAKGAYPWVGALFRRENSIPEFLCAASLITEKLALTGLCAESFSDLEPLYVTFGRLDFMDWLDENTQNKKVEKVIYHPDFKNGEPDGDIAILQFEEPLTFTFNVKPVCLWEMDSSLENIVNETGVIVGWGRNENRTYPKKLQTLYNPVVSQETCLRSSEAYIYITSDRTFCAGDNINSGVCIGDMGSGFYFYVNQRWTIRGLATRTLITANGECDLLHYAVYTDVAKYVQWIHKFL